MFYPLHLASMLTYDIRMCRRNVVRYRLWERFRRFCSVFFQSASEDGQQEDSQEHFVASSADSGGPGQGTSANQSDEQELERLRKEKEEQERLRREKEEQERLRQEELKRLEELRKKKNGGTGGDKNNPGQQGV